MSAAATAAPLRKRRAMPNGRGVAYELRSSRPLQCVNEYVDGRVREVFVLDDDSPPPTTSIHDHPLHSSRSAGSNPYDGGSHDGHYTYAVHRNGSERPGANGNGHGGSSSKRKHKAVESPPAVDDSGDTSYAYAPGVRYFDQHGQVVHAAPPAAPTGSTSTAKRRRRDEGDACAAQRPVPGPAEYAHQHQSAYLPPAATYGSTTYYPNGTNAYAAPGAYQPPHLLYKQSSGSYFQPDQSQSISPSLSSRPPPPPLTTCDDKEGHYICREHDVIGVEGRYRIVRLLGQGTFGKVVQCYDKATRRYVAVKIIRAIQKYRDASKVEIRVLKLLKEHDPGNANKCIHLLECFNFRNHVCIVSELLGQSVFDFLKENDFVPFPPAQIWQFAKQLLTSVAFIHDLRLIHTDLKPENILLVNSKHKVVPVGRRTNAKMRKVLENTDIRLIDFGSATFQDEYHSAVVSTRHYRAPEIILGMGWSYPCDVWSIGCILVEFYTGEALFQTHDNLEHLAMMEACLGQMPATFAKNAARYRPEYFRGTKLDYPNSTTQRGSRKWVKAMQKLQDVIPPSATSPHNQRFLSLVRRLLDFDPNTRITVRDALAHPYFELRPEEIPESR